MIPYARQNITEADVAAVVAVLKSDWLTQGPAVARFERAVADRVGAAHAVACNSGTSALHIACLALDLGPGDHLWTSPNSFVASANCGLYCGAEVDFVDIDARTYNLSVDALEEKLERAEREGRLPKIVVPVHFAGQPCDMAAIALLARRYGFKVVEDASHAVGARYRGAPIGNCAHSDITVFSFHPVKIITTAEGGMALTNNPNLARRMGRLRTHGVTRDRDEMQAPEKGAWYYEQVELGLNYRMTDIQAALGLSQHQRINEFLQRRREIARTYDEGLAELTLIRPFQHPDGESAWHLYVVQVDVRRAQLGRQTLFERLRAAGIGVNVHYIPVHTQPYYLRRGFRLGQYPEAERYYSNALSLPVFYDFEPAQQATVIAALARELRV
jgi:UDP-4-amino-4,6-dideoxy-N-acetyl-beta-L-altrosamine transaminase